MEGTHVIALNREQMQMVAKAASDALEREDLLTLYIVATTDPEVTRWFDAATKPSVGDELDALEMMGEVSSVFVGDVFVLAVDYEITPRTMEEMGLG